MILCMILICYAELILGSSFLRSGWQVRERKDSWPIGQVIKKRWQVYLSLQNEVAAQHDPDDSQIDHGADDLTDAPCGGARSRIGSFNQFDRTLPPIQAMPCAAMPMSGNYTFGSDHQCTNRAARKFRMPLHRKYSPWFSLEYFLYTDFYFKKLVGIMPALGENPSPDKRSRSRPLPGCRLRIAGLPIGSGF